MAILKKLRTSLIILTLTMVFFNGSDAQDLSGLIPSLQNLPAPDWIREGTRLSYYSATASIPSAYERFVPDEEGDWVGVNSGKRYRREELFGAAGHGVTQVDVLSADARAAVLKVNAWLYSSYTGPLVPIKQAASIGLPAGGDWYIHPAALASLKDQRGGGVTVLRMPYKIGTVTYDAIRIQQEDDRSTFVRIYDLSDGKLLASFNSVISADQKVTTLSEAILIGIRQMDLPWLGHDLPSWIGPGASLRYEGTKSYEAIRAGTVLPASVSIDISIDDAARRYYTYTQRVSTYIPGFPTQYSEEKLAGGVGEPGGLVLPPASLASLRSGQILDSDPVTGITTRVVDTTRDDTGRDVAVVKSNNQAYSVEFGYDIRTGMLVSLSETKLGEEYNEYLSVSLS
ncbi:MAG TPA: hypothetical protein PK659_03820 [Methanothrix sp.]|nr:hypothetical protein [Methanothrix sp.]HOK57965.1 hypothetical protein [Methanothrix sp.]HOL43368.1 hypothetical protein [Methanothrix sp.]HPO88371.1 hypothetical protein [Methanothrix sp.]